MEQVCPTVIPCKHTATRRHLTTRKHGVTRHQIYQQLILDIFTSRTWVIHFCCLYATQIMIFVLTAPQLFKAHYWEELSAWYSRLPLMPLMPLISLIHPGFWECKSLLLLCELQEFFHLFLSTGSSDALRSFPSEVLRIKLKLRGEHFAALKVLQHGWLFYGAEPCGFWRH